LDSVAKSKTFAWFQPKKFTLFPSASFTLSNLHPNTQYSIKLAAKSVHGVGAFTPTVQVTTMPDGEDGSKMFFLSLVPVVV